MSEVELDAFKSVSRRALRAHEDGVAHCGRTRPGKCRVNSVPGRANEVKVRGINAERNQISIHSVLLSSPSEVRKRANIPSDPLRKVGGVRRCHRRRGRSLNLDICQAMVRDGVVVDDLNFNLDFADDRQTTS